MYSQIRNMKIKQIYIAEILTKKGGRVGSLPKQKWEPECGSHAIYRRAKIITQNHTCLVWYTKPYVTQETNAEYLLNKINMYPMLIPLNSWTRVRLIKTQELAEKGTFGSKLQSTEWDHKYAQLPTLKLR